MHTLDALGAAPAHPPARPPACLVKDVGVHPAGDGVPDPAVPRRDELPRDDRRNHHNVDGDGLVDLRGRGGGGARPSGVGGGDASAGSDPPPAHKLPPCGAPSRRARRGSCGVPTRLQPMHRISLLSAHPRPAHLLRRKVGDHGEGVEHDRGGVPPHHVPVRPGGRGGREGSCSEAAVVERRTASSIHRCPPACACPPGRLPPAPHPSCRAHRSRDSGRPLAVM